MDDKMKIKILKTLLIAGHVSWGLFAVVALSHMKTEGVKHRRLHDFTKLLGDVVTRENPELFADDEIQTFLINHEFEKITGLFPVAKEKG